MGAHHLTARAMADRQHLTQCGTGRSWAALTVGRHDWRGTTTITATGELDLDSAPLLRRELDRCLDGGVHDMAVDLAGVTFCDCSGLSSLLQAHRRGAVLGTSLWLQHPRPFIARLIALAGAETTLLPWSATGMCPLSVRSLPARDAAVDPT
ncbi:STAS domain-containing protein [Streptacidiphilus rugosus]|uniref:STAS domain-containing protein n=1 Tax=Streptacidiphilus rugosus TaxID=405783 RepID=UPI00068BFC2D